MKKRLLGYALIGVVSGMLYFIGHLDGASAVLDNQTTAESEQLLHVSKAWHQRQDSTEAAEARHMRRFMEIVQTADSMAAASSTDTMPNPWRHTALKYREAVQACSIVITTCKQRADSAELKVKQLESQLGKQIAVGKCYLFRVGPIHPGCFTRKSVYIAGIVSGVTLHELIQIWIR